MSLKLDIKYLQKRIKEVGKDNTIAKKEKVYRLIALKELLHTAQIKRLKELLNSFA